MLRCFLKRLIDPAIYQLQEGHHRTKNQEKTAIKRKKVAYFYTTLHSSAKTYIVASTGLNNLLRINKLMKYRKRIRKLVFFGLQNVSNTLA